MNNSISVFENLQDQMNMKMGYKHGPCFNDKLLESQDNEPSYDDKYEQLFQRAIADKKARHGLYGRMLTETTGGIHRDKKAWLETSEGQRYAASKTDDANKAVFAALARVSNPSKELLEVLGGIDVDEFFALQKRLG